MTSINEMEKVYRDIKRRFPRTSDICIRSTILMCIPNLNDKRRK